MLKKTFINTLFVVLPYWWTWMYGATKNNAGSLTSLAKSWVNPPKLIINSGASESEYNSTQRCFEIANEGDKEINNLDFTLQANTESPAVNPAFVIRNWGDHPVQLKVNGNKVNQGKTFRVGQIRRINQYDLVVWLELESTTNVKITMEN